MSEYRARAFDEYSQLTDRVEKLKEYIVSGDYDKLPQIEREALKEQLGYMRSYLEVLSKRVSRMCNNG